MKDFIEKLNNLKGEDFARVIFKGGLHPDYKDCSIMRGTYDEDENFIEDGRFHVTCWGYEIPPVKPLRNEIFDTAAEVFEKFIVDGKPLAEIVEDIDDSQELIDF